MTARSDQYPFSAPSCSRWNDQDPNFLGQDVTHRSADTMTSSISEDSLQVPKHWFVSGVSIHSSKVLGRGSFGTVCLGDWLGCPVAIKKPHEIFFDKSVSETERDGILKAFAREVNILFQLKHPNIVMFYGLFDDGGRTDQMISSETCLVQELLQCSLSSRNHQTPRLTYRNIIDLSIGIAGGLRYLHEREEPIVHRDLASKNVLVSQNGVPKIADLGVAKVISSSHKFIHLSRQPGTELYMPPEVKIEGMQYDSRIDIYSFGVIVLEMGVGRDPTAGEAFRANGAAEGGVYLVPETERRRRDLQDLGESPLKGLVLHCFARKDERPSAMTVFQKLVALKNHRYYQSQLDTPVMPLSLEHLSPSSQRGQHEWHQAMEDKVKQLEFEKEELVRKMTIGRREGGSLPNRLEELSSTYPKGNRVLSEIEISRIQKAHMEKSAMSNHYGSQTEQERIRLLEATVRSRDSEIASLRECNIRLEQEIASHRGMYLSGFQNEKLPPTGLMARGIPSSPPYSNGSITPPSGPTRDVETELKQVRRSLEKYKNLTVELDAKLKDAKLELSRYENRQTSSHVQARYENEAIRAENCVLRSEVDRLRRECSHLQAAHHYPHY